MGTRRDFLLRSAALAATIPAARAQPIESARILCGFPPGGTTDAMSRRLADKLRGAYAATVFVENKPGAAGQIGIAALKDSPADGSVMLLTPSSMLSLYPFVYKALPYDPATDVQPASLACYYDHALGVGPAVPASVKDAKDFIRWARANPDRANFASPGAGSVPHLIGTLLSRQSGVALKHVPYRGSAPGVQDLLGGQVAAMSSPLGDHLPHMGSGRVRVLAVAGMKRSRFAPDVATYREQGFDIGLREWYGVFLPGRSSADVVGRASAALQSALAQPDFVAGMALLGKEVQSSTPGMLAALLRADLDHWGRSVRELGFTAES